MATRKKPLPRPRLTKNVVAGLKIVEKLAWADLESAEEDDATSYENGQIACKYLRQLIAWHSQKT